MYRFFLSSIFVLLITNVFSGCSFKPNHEHNWIEATCQSPKTCTICQLNDGSVGEHKWTEATCYTPQTCKICGITEGETTNEHDWTTETEDSPSVCIFCRKMRPLRTLPENGQVFIGSDLARNSTLTIHDDWFSSTYYYIKLKDEYGKDVFSFFVSPRQALLDSAGYQVDLDALREITVEVPSGKYYVYLASGRSWYGTKYLFGEDTEYSKMNELLDFTKYTYTITVDQRFSYGPSSSSNESSSIGAEDF